MSDISLSKAVRSNLLSLQDTARMMGRTQERLSTGNKVNSALDNPTNFFTASSLNSRAGDLKSLMDSMANGIQTLEAADNGLTSITKTLESMQSTLRQARQDKSFQTDSFSLDPETIGVGLARKLDFTNGAFETPGSIDLHKNVVVGQNGFANGGTAGKAGTVEITTPSLNGGTAITVAFTAADTVETFAAKINAHIGTLDDSGGVSARVSNGQLEIASAKAEAITLGGTELEYIGLGGADEAATPATRDGSGAVAAGAIGAFSFTINGLTVNVGAVNNVAATDNGDDIVDQINNSSAAQAAGVVAVNNAGTVELSNADGKNFTVNGTGLGTLNITAGVTTDGIPASGTAVPPVPAFAVKTVDELVREINRDTDLKSKIRASNDNGKLRMENLSTQDLDVAGVTSSGIVDGTSFGAAKIAGNSVRGDLAGQFNELRDQLDKLADDASFNGINLLRGDNLKITFNENGTSSIDIQSKNGDALSAANLGLYDLVAKNLDADTDIDTLLGEVKMALGNVRSQASSFGYNLSIVQNRQDFTKEMVNTLQTGAANLTLADMNEEAANLLALQTRQSLSSSSLSLASQADQSVLQLLQ
ncbi:flagellin [Devosia sp.]|uniref:flagellin N-terminal helical domain-containing protein n=1 Tax=Devosia sp. TaxID=1871048 RepID=UPI002733E651|nr:flagellin [Devosia sp.]MDP2778991.1 flagellin [Devosia sp.]